MTGIYWIGFLGGICGAFSYIEWRAWLYHRRQQREAAAALAARPKCEMCGQPRQVKKVIIDEDGPREIDLCGACFMESFEYQSASDDP